MRKAKALLLMMTAVLVLGSMGCKKDPASKRGGEDTTSPSQSRDNKKVLLVQSYHRNYPCADAVTRGVRMALSKSDSNVDLQIFYMDTKRKPSEAWMRQAGEEAKKVVADWKPDVVIASDDNAQEYFVGDYAGQPRPQFVFCGVNARPEKYGYPAVNITGVLERPHMKETLELLHSFLPRIRNIAIVTDDSLTSAGTLEFMTSPPKPFEIVSVKTPSTFEEWKKAIQEAQTSADALAIYIYHTVKRRPGEESMDPKEVMDWTVKHSRIPILGFLTFAVDDGALCGYLESSVEQGLIAGQMAVEILNGKRAVEIPIVTAVKGQSMLNLNTARKLGISVPIRIVEQTDVVIGK